MKTLIFLFLLLPTSIFAQITDVDEYVSWISGEFSSEVQAKQDSSFWHVQINQDVIDKVEDGYWLWVTQGIPEEELTIYRERLYHISQLDENTILTKIFKVEDGQKVHLKGCNLYIEKIKDMYVGGTSNFDCKSTYGGASYLTTDFRVYEDRIESWERGWNSSGTLVWGTDKGHFIFIKNKEIEK